jgi:hypothetical protein
MKRLIVNAKQKSSLLIISMLLLANLVAFGIGAHYLGSTSSQRAETEQTESVIKQGWQLLGWGYSLMESLHITPPSAAN